MIILQLEGDVQHALQTGSLKKTEQDLQELTGSSRVTFAFKSPTLLQVNLTTSAVSTPRDERQQKQKPTRKSPKRQNLNPPQLKARKQSNLNSLSQSMSRSISGSSMFMSQSHDPTEWKQQIASLEQSVRDKALSIGGMRVIGLWKPLFLNISVQKINFSPAAIFGAAFQGMYVCLWVWMGVCTCRPLQRAPFCCVCVHACAPACLLACPPARPPARVCPHVFVWVSATFSLAVSGFMHC